VVGEKRLKARGKKSKLGLYDENVFHVALLGPVVKEGSEEPPELLYSVTSHAPRDKIANIHQTAGTILGHSRRQFFTGIQGWRSYGDPRKMEVSYCDTDSCLIAGSRPRLQDLLREEHQHRADELLSTLMEDPTAETHQTGKFKLEGPPYREALFRSGKCYLLAHPLGKDDDDEEVRRMRSIQRRHVQKLARQHYGQDPTFNVVTVRGIEMKPSLAGQITVGAQSRTLPHSSNTKRIFVVKKKNCCFLTHFHPFPPTPSGPLPL
jgi:hypothetical protein